MCVYILYELSLELLTATAEGVDERIKKEGRKERAGIMDPRAHSTHT